MFTIRIEYDDMEMAAGELNNLADEISQTYSQMQQQCQALMDGQWIGQGANVFYDEFENMVTPSMNRLVTALTNSSAKIKETSAKFDDAEHECKVKVEISFN